MTDGYKIGHYFQYPKELELVCSNLTARKTRRENTKKVVFFGLQYFLKEYLIKQWNINFFQRPKNEVCTEQYASHISAYLSDQNVNCAHLEALHDLGYIPLEFYSLPEGTEYEIRVPCVLYWSTHKKFAWFTNYIETIFSVTIWGPCTSATTAHQYKKLLTQYALETVGDTSFVPFQGHDFSFRGMFGLEAAKMSGAAHLISFVGTDTIPAIPFLEEYYNADHTKELIGCSVPATEHSVSCTVILNFVNKTRTELTKFGKVVIKDELMNLADIEYVRYLIQEVYPTGIVSIVADSFDYWNTITNTAKVLKDVILGRNGKVVFRPDTGNPVKIVCGYRDDQIVIYRDKTYEADPKSHSADLKGREITENEIKGSVECLWEIFGGVTTPKGYRLLDSHVGIIYGDSITLQRSFYICEGLKQKGFASTNIVFGIGSYTYQCVTRDTDGYAVKATYCEIAGEPINIYKDPKTDDGTKKSACGLVAVYQDDTGGFYAKDQVSWDEVRNCALIPVFKDGVLLKDYTLQEVRDNLAQYL